MALSIYRVTFYDAQGNWHVAFRRAAWGRPEVNGLDGSKAVLRNLRASKTGVVRTASGKRVRIDLNKLIRVWPEERRA